MAKMDFSKFKKVSADDSHSILKHPDGHVIKIAHASLSPQTRKELLTLPIHAAEGTDVVKDPTENLQQGDSQDASHVININVGGQPNATSAATGQPVEAAAGATPAPTNFLSPEAQHDVYGRAFIKSLQENRPMKETLAEVSAQRDAEAKMYQGNAQAAGPVQENQQQAAPQLVPPEDRAPASKQKVQKQVAAAPVPAQAPAAPSLPGAPSPEMAQAQQQFNKAYQDHFINHAAELGEQTAQFGQDLQNGHIQPQTYQSLFASKDTLGKVGTLFGLLVSGAGSGLSHQPSAVLNMMDKQIENDLKAQQQSKENAQNFLRINQAAELNKANVALTQKQTAGVGIENQIKAQTLAKNQMLLTWLHNAQSEADKLPANSPVKQRYIQGLNGVGQIIDQKIQQNNKQAASQLAGISQAQYFAQAKNWRNAELAGLPGGEMMAKDIESKALPGVGYSDVQLSDDDKKKATSISNFQNLINEYQRLVNKVGAARGDLGVLTPGEKKTAKSIRNDLITSYNDVKGLTRFTGNEEELYKDIVPNLGEMNLTGSQQDLLDRLRTSVAEKKKLEYSRMSIHPFSDAQEPQSQTQTAVSKSGRPIELKDGKWVYKKVSK